MYQYIVIYRSASIDYSNLHSLKPRKIGHVPINFWFPLQVPPSELQGLVSVCTLHPHV